MKHLLVVISLLTFILSCHQKKDRRLRAFDFIPESTHTVVKINDLEAFKNDLGNNGILNPTSQADSSWILSSVPLLHHIRTQNDIVVAFDETDRSVQLITKYHDSLFLEDTTYVKNIDKDLFKDNRIHEQTMNNDTIYSAIIDSFLVASSVRKYLEHSIKNPSANKKFSSLQELSSDASASLFVATNSGDSIPKEFNFLHENSMLDIDLSSDHIKLSGVTKHTDSTSKIINYLNNTRSQQNMLPSIIPNDSKQFLSYTFHDLSQIKLNYEQIDNISDDGLFAEIQDLLIEMGSFDIEDSEALAIRSIDVDAVSETIEKTLEETFRQIDIYSLPGSDEIVPLFTPLIDASSMNYIFVIDDFLVYTSSIEHAKKIISSVTNKTTLLNSDIYKAAKDNISDESTLLYFSLSSELSSVVERNLPSLVTDRLVSTKFKKEHSQIIQLINDNGFAHVNVQILRQRQSTKSNSVTEMFNLALDNELLNDPQLVKNHITGQKDIAVQDIHNNLYLISNRGKLLWKKQIPGNVLGKIEQIDMYKNGRLQLVFATPNAIHVLDRHGKNVAPFPIKFNDEITQPLSVFDYDKKKDYRLMVVQGKNTLMYDAKGKRVRGFTFRSASQDLKSQPKHFRVNNKDYIVFAAGEKMYVLNRRGQERITVNEAIEFSGNGIYLYKNNFTTTNTKGQLVQVDQRGRIAKQNLILQPGHQVSATSKTLATLADNKLTIRSRSIELDFGEYTPPRIFYLKDKIYVSVTDLQTQKTYLFDSQAKLLPNFPIYGTSSMTMDNIDKDRSLEFVVRGDSNSVILYQLN